MKSFTVEIAGEQHFKYAEPICQLIESSAKQRGTGIAKRKPEYVTKKWQQEMPLSLYMAKN